MPEGYARKPKTIFGTKAWKEFKAEAQHIFGRMLGQAVETEAALQDMSEGEFALARKTKSVGLAPSDAALDVLGKASARDRPLETGNTHDLDCARLAALARRLYLNAPGVRLNHESLASALKISVATLYRRFTAAEIRAALKTAKQPLRPEAEAKDDGEDTPEKDHDTIVGYTTETELEWIDSPAILGKKNPSPKKRP